jgi:hypothetical protein
LGGQRKEAEAAYLAAPPDDFGQRVVWARAWISCMTFPPRRS